MRACVHLFHGIIAKILVFKRALNSLEDQNIDFMELLENIPM